MQKVVVRVVSGPGLAVQVTMVPSEGTKGTRPWGLGWLPIMHPALSDYFKLRLSAG